MKNKRTIEDILKLAGNSVSLSGTEKTKIRHQLIKVSTVRRFYFAKFVLAPLLIIILLTSTVAASSIGSLPGDRLYAVKTGIVEPAIGLFKDRLEHEGELASRRLEEMVTLSAEGRLDEERKARALGLFEKHREIIKERSENIDPEKIVEVESNLESVLRANSRVFAGLGETDLEEEINKNIGDVVARRLSAENVINPGSKAASLIEERVSGEIAKIEESIDGSEVDLAKESLIEAQEHIDAGSYKKAIVLLNRASRFANEAKIVSETQSKFAIKEKKVDSGRVEHFLEAVKAPEEKEVMEVVTTLVEERQDSPYEHFQNLMVGLYRESKEPSVYIRTLPGLVTEDFNGVVLDSVLYQVVDGEISSSSADYSDDNEEGYARLLINIATRLKTEISSDKSVDYLWQIIQEKQDEVLETEEVLIINGI